MKIIYIGRSVDSIKYFTKLIQPNEDYQLVKCFEYTDNYKELISTNEIDCVVVEMSVHECQDVNFIKYFKTIDPYLVAFGDNEVKNSIKYLANNDLKYFDFLSITTKPDKLNAYFEKLAVTTVELNMSEFFDAYVDEDSIVFDDDKLEKFVAFLTCRRKKIIEMDEILQVLYPNEENDAKKEMKIHGLCCMFQSVLEESNVSHIFNYNGNKCIFNYHLITSDFYKYINGEFKEFNNEFLSTINCDFISLINEENQKRRLRGALDFEEFYFDQEVYLPFDEEYVEEEFNLVIPEETPVVEESFMDKAINNSMYQEEVEKEEKKNKKKRRLFNR